MKNVKVLRKFEGTKENKNEGFTVEYIEDINKARGLIFQYPDGKRTVMLEEQAIRTYYSIDAMAGSLKLKEVEVESK
jgi:hypothetical protein